MQSDTSETSKMDKITDLLLAGKLPEARKLADSIADVDYREWMFNDLVKSLIGAGAIDPAVVVGRFMADSYYKADALRSVAKYLASSGNLRDALSIIEESNKIPLEIQLPGALEPDIAPDRASAIYDLSKLFANAGDMEHANALKEEAIKVARTGEGSTNSQHSIDSSKVLRNFARDMAMSGDMAGATTVAQSIAHFLVQEEALEMLAEMEQ
jgi:tetratricopeptide (TPR) repeat protein